jgi:ribosomal protein S18 acetylase RimI-like enzyme
MVRASGMMKRLVATGVAFRVMQRRPSEPLPFTSGRGWRVVGTDGLAEAALCRSLEGNFVSFFSRMARATGGRLDRTGRGIRICSGVPFSIFNWALQSRIGRGECDQYISETIAFFRSRGTPFCWAISPSDRAGELRDRLVARGLEEGRAPGMALDLSHLEPQDPPEGLMIRAVRTPEDAETFARTLNEGDFRQPEAVARSIRDVLRPAPLEEAAQARLDCFVGYWNDEPVCTSAMFGASDVAGIWGIATVPQARRRGFGAAITRAALELGHARGYRSAVLVATSPGEPVYRSLGFREILRISQFENPLSE